VHAISRYLRQILFQISVGDTEIQTDSLTLAIVCLVNYLSSACFIFLY